MAALTSNGCPNTRHFFCRDESRTEFHSDTQNRNETILYNEATKERSGVGEWGRVQNGECGVRNFENIQHRTLNIEVGIRNGRQARPAFAWLWPGRRAACGYEPELSGLQQFLDQGLGVFVGDAQGAMRERAAFVEDGFAFFERREIGALPKQADGDSASH